MAGQVPCQTDIMKTQLARHTELIELIFEAYWVFEPSPATAIHTGINEIGLMKPTPILVFAVEQVVDRIFPSLKKSLLLTPNSGSVICFTSNSVNRSDLSLQSER